MLALPRRSLCQHLKAIAVKVVKYLTFIEISQVKYETDFKTESIKDEKNESQMRGRLILNKACILAKLFLRFA